MFLLAQANGRRAGASSSFGYIGAMKRILLGAFLGMVVVAFVRPIAGQATTNAATAASLRVGGSGNGFVAQRIRARHQAVGEGGQPHTDLITGTLRTGQTRIVPFEVEGGQCYIVLGAGLPSVRELDIRVFDSYSNERSRDHESDAFPFAKICPSVAGRWSVEVNMFNGYGQYGLQIFKTSQRATN